MKWIKGKRGSEEQNEFNQILTRIADYARFPDGRYNWEQVWTLFIDDPTVNKNMIRMRVRKTKARQLDSAELAKITDTSFSGITLDKIPSSSAKIYDLKQANLETWNDKLSELRKLNRMIRLAFVTDLHMPHQDDNALELAQNIVYDFNPDIMPDLSDLFEFQKMGSWKEKFPQETFKRVWENDIERPIVAYHQWAKIRNQIAPNAEYPQLWGNHDIRIFMYMADKSVTAHWTFHKFLEELGSTGSLYLGHDLDKLLISPGFAIWHGEYANQDASSTAKATLLKRTFYEYSGMVGHIHRFGTSHFKDKEFHTIGCLTQNPPPYDHKIQHWQQGIGLAYINMNTDEAHIKPIKFTDTGDHLTAVANGKHYSVKKVFQVAVANTGQRIPKREIA